MKVRDFMSTRVVTVRPDSPVTDAARLMLEANISGLPVVNGGGKVIGIVTEHDLLRRKTDESGLQTPHWLQLMADRADFANASARFREAKVEEVMTRDPLTVTEDTPVEEACRLISERAMKRLPVVRDGRLVGIVARADLVRALAVAARRISTANQRLADAEARLSNLQRESILRRTRPRT